MSDGYRARMMACRHMNSYDILINQSIHACASQSVPIVHLTPNGLKLIRFFPTDVGFISFPYDMQYIPVWELMNFEAETWKNIPRPGEQNFSEAVKIELDRYFSFLQEVVMRSNCRALQFAVLNRNFLRCPWSKHGCHMAQPMCQEIKRLGDIPEHECSIRKYLAIYHINPNNIIWRNGDII
jgi:hypothetical protein